MTEGVRRSLVPLEPLDLRNRSTVGQVVDGMSRCAFGARMLGDVAATWGGWLAAGKAPLALYDGDDTSPLQALIRHMLVRDGLLSGVMNISDLHGGVLSSRAAGKNLVVIGRYAERDERMIHSLSGEVIFINEYGLANPGQIRDGYFPGAVFADPRLVLPLLQATLCERRGMGSTTVVDMFEQLSAYGGLSTELAKAGDTLRAMMTDDECCVFLTLSGAMTIAKMGLPICELIDRNFVHVVASTGALMAHNLIEGMGLHHYKHHPSYSDAVLAAEHLNRVTDTLEPEENFTQAAEVLDAVLEDLPGGVSYSPSQLHRMLGEYLASRYPTQRGILKSAFERGVPVLVPAFVDSELGNDVFVHNLQRRERRREPVIIWPERDSHLLVEMATTSKRIGIFSIGGGVPRNNVQNLAPLIEIANERAGEERFTPRMFTYGCRIAPDPMWYGHLSGCTYDENGSWRKMDLENGSFAEVHVDATIVLPFIVRYLMDTVSDRI